MEVVLHFSGVFIFFLSMRAIISNRKTATSSPTSYTNGKEFLGGNSMILDQFFNIEVESSYSFHGLHRSKN